MRNNPKIQNKLVQSLLQVPASGHAQVCSSGSTPDNDNEIGVCLTVGSPNSFAPLSRQPIAGNDADLDVILVALIHALAEAAIRRQNRIGHITAIRPSEKGNSQ
jgi:hypothetical protein